MSVPSSAMAFLTMMTFLLWLTVQLTFHPSQAYILNPLPVNWEPLVALNYTENHNIASLLTGDSLASDAAKCVTHLNTHLNASRVCKEQLYDWFKIENWHNSNTNTKDKFVQYTLNCYFRLACVNCPDEQVTEYRKAVKDWFFLYQCNPQAHVCVHKDWQSLVTECFDPPMTELAQCDAALEQANATDNCTAQVQLKLNQTKEVHPRILKCTAEDVEHECMVAQVCEHCDPKHVPKYFEYWNKVWNPSFEERWGSKYHPPRECNFPQDYTLVIVIVGVVAAIVIIISLMVICCRKRSAKRTRKYGSHGTGRSSSKSRSTSRSSSSSGKAK